jgi:hypothetical protein
MTRLGSLLRRWACTALGLVTAALFLLAEGFLHPSSLLAVPLRWLIVPLWLMRYVQVWLGLASWPWALQVAVGLPLLFLPYIGADMLRHRWRREFA